jgi:nicotinate-nucleotide adenylyltransferase
MKEVRAIVADKPEELHLGKVQRMGLMGGTFDPIHQGHLVTAEAARSRFQLDKVVFVPSGQPPHKSGKTITSKEKRYLMTELATVTNPYFEVSRVEINRPGASFAIDTVLYFRELLAPGSEIYFITGADAIMEIVTWKDVNLLFENCIFIAATRPGFNLTRMRQRLEKQLLPSQLERIIPIEVPAMAISSTDIRHRVAERRTIKYLLPESAENYIYKNDLYKK